MKWRQNECLKHTLDMSEINICICDETFVEIPQIFPYPRPHFSHSPELVVCQVCAKKKNESLKYFLILSVAQCSRIYTHTVPVKWVGWIERIRNSEILSEQSIYFSISTIHSRVTQRTRKAESNSMLMWSFRYDTNIQSWCAFSFSHFSSFLVNLESR